MNKVTKLLASLLLLAAVLVGLYALMLARQPKPVAPVPAAVTTTNTVNQYSVVVASKPLLAGKPIPTDAVRVEKLPFRPTNSYSDSAEVVGKLPVNDVGIGVPLLQTHLSGGLASQIAEGERAVAVNVDEAVAVGYRIKPGDFVDVFFVLKQDNSEVSPSQSRLLLSRLRVLATGSTSVNEDTSKADAARAPARTAVLSVPIEDVNMLTLAQHAGRLTLALRNPKDEDVPSESLFPRPSSVLQARDFKPGSTDSVSGKVLTRELVNEPVNHAFAGTSLPGLSAKKDGLPVRVGSVSPGRMVVIEGVEIIRGGVRQ